MTEADDTTIGVLVQKLQSDDGQARSAARKELVHIGAAAVNPLRELLGSADKTARWEAAKALGQIADPAACDDLIAVLEDQEEDIRWLAAEGLIALGLPAAPPLLRKLVPEGDNTVSTWLCVGAHHVLSKLATEDTADALQPVIDALHRKSSDQISPAADRALGKLQT